MNILIHPTVSFAGAGLFRTHREWIHPARPGINYEIIYVVEGEVFIAEEDREYCLTAGQVLLLSKGLSHRGTRTSRDVSFYWVHFELSDGELPFLCRCFDRFENAALFKELLHASNLPVVPEFLVNSILLHILSELCYLSGEHAKTHDPRAERIYEWLRIHTTAKLTVDFAAHTLGYSPDHLTRICKRHFGIGARELMSRFLLDRIKMLLSNSDLYLKEIARELEFSDDKALIGYFKYHEGATPTEFRDRYPCIHMNAR